MSKATDDLVDRFAAVLKEKLNAAEQKYGYSDAWMFNNWLNDLRRDIRIHLEKGDPRDVAAYCAFAWHHGWSLKADEVPKPMLREGLARNRAKPLVPHARYGRRPDTSGGANG